MKIAGNQRYFAGRFVSIFPYVGFHAHEIRQASRLQSIFCGKTRFHFPRAVCFQFGQTSRLLQEAFPSGKASLYFAGFSLSVYFLFFLENSMESVKLPAYCNQLSSLEENPRCFIQICQTSRLLQDAYATGNASL